uniref:Uncharacterized protein n=1 Tax=Lepeophtheirus salmonis TaxID=72036 RepID=A0A0K2VIM1_LEPSM
MYTFIKLEDFYI